MKQLVISSIQIVPIQPKNGLLSFAACEINYCLYVGNIAIYSSPNSPLGLRLVFPTKKLSSGKQVHCFYPFTQEAEEQISRPIKKRYLELMENFHFVE